MSELLPVPLKSARSSILTPDRKAAFLEKLALFGNVRLSCKAACVSAQTAYRARRQSPAFQRAWDAALLAARTHAEQELADRAINGVEEAVYYHGEEVARRRRYDARLLLAHLGRLDRLAERVDVAATLPHLDEQIDALKRGEELPEDAGDGSTPRALRQAQDERFSSEDAVAVRPDEGAGKDPQDSVPCVPSNGADADCEEADEPEGLGPDDPMWLGNRLDRMDAARPAGALQPYQLANARFDAGDVEAAQLYAFEAGEAEWWLAMPDTLLGDELHVDAGVAAADHADLLGGGAAEVDHAAPDERPAIVDADGDGASVARVGHLHEAAER